MELGTTTACPRCTRPTAPGDRFCGGCGSPQPARPGAARSSITEAVEDALGDPSAMTAPITVPTPRAEDLTPSPTPSTDPSPERATVRSEVREVAREVHEDWKGMSGKDKAGTVAVGIYNGFATLWNTALTLAVIAGIGLWLFTSCSGSGGLSASTTCDQYLQMDEQTRYAQAQDLGRRASGSTFRGPMAGLNLDYSCSESRGTRTIGSIMGIGS